MISPRNTLLLAFTLALPLGLTDRPAPAAFLSNEGGASTCGLDVPGRFAEYPSQLATASGHPLFPMERLTGGPKAAVAFCFAPGTDPEVIAYYNQLMLTDPEGTRYQLGGRWSGAQGSPRALTWSFVPDGLAVDGGTSDLFARMDALFAAQGGRATWIARIQSCFDRWAALTGTSYTRITFGGNDWDDGANWGSIGNASRGDLRIGMINIDGGSGTLAYNYFPSNGDMVLDRSENWASATNSNRFLRDVVMHEHGHGMGIQHVCSSNSSQLMEPFINTSFDGPQDDDLRGAQRHYGDNFEPNDTSATATNLGTVNIGAPISLGPVPAPNISFASVVTLDADGENDYYRFTVTGARSASLTLTPVGRTYDNSSQNGDGSCNSGNNINSMTMANLSLQIIGTDGSTVLGTADSQPAGAAETISNVSLGAGNYFARVYEANAPVEAQYYTLSISVSDLDCNANGLLDPCDIDCGAPGCALPGCGQADDCNGNSLPDECEDCNNNTFADACDITSGTSFDCNDNNTPDECDAVPDCNANNTPDDCDITAGTSGDCNLSSVPDDCELAAGTSLDCNATGTPDECELFGFDCNGNGVPDSCDIASAVSQDCNADALPDECDLAANRDYDCNLNGTLDSCDLATAASGDCNTNGLPDECESESCAGLWGGFEPDPPFGTGAFINGVDYNSDGNAWQNLSNTATIGNQGCPASTGKALKSVAQVPSPTDFFPVTSEFFRTVGGALPPGSPIWSLSFDVRSEAQLNPRIDWQMSIRDGSNNANVMLIHWASTQSSFAGVSAAMRGRILVQNPAGTPTFLSTGFAIPANTCYTMEVRLNTITQQAELYINGILRISITPLQLNANRIDYFKLEQRGNGQAAGGINRLGLDNFSICQTGAEPAPGGAPDCNANNVWDDCDIADGTSADANANGTPDECESGAPAATVTGALSRKACDLALALSPGVTSESRQGGPNQVRIAFNVAPGGPGLSPVTLQEKQCPAPGTYVPYAGSAVMGSSVVGNELVLTFTPGLENARSYRLNIGPLVTSVPGQFVELRGLVGDANSDGLVNATDRSMVIGIWTGVGFTCPTDLNGDGITNATDRSIVVSAWTSAQNCAP